jgi:hypothetical protein
MKIGLVAKWYDGWIGYFWDRKARRLYLLPVPWFGIWIQIGEQKIPAHQRVMNEFKGFFPSDGEADLFFDLYKLCSVFAAVMFKKLIRKEMDRKADGKDPDAWKDPANIQDLQISLDVHVDKGDPIDVACFAAFLWYHKAQTKPHHVYDALNHQSHIVRDPNSGAVPRAIGSGEATLYGTKDQTPFWKTVDPIFILFRDGDQVCAIGPEFINLQESNAGFGRDAFKAIDDLIKRKSTRKSDLFSTEQSLESIIKEMRNEADQHEFVFRDCGSGHLQLKIPKTMNGGAVINYWPNSKKRLMYATYRSGEIKRSVRDYMDVIRVAVKIRNALQTGADVQA